VVETTNANPTVDHGHSAEPGDGSSRRDFIHIAAIAVGGVGAVAAVWPFIDQMNPSADTLALASIEYDFSKVAVGSQASIKWRGKPVFVRHRTPKEIADAVAVDHAAMRDPANDASRQKAG
jgi:ubiquinol-cytochrome c reductase iron-sulfur subunit